MITVFWLALLIGVSLSFGYLFGIRIERGRHQRLAEISTETKRRGGTRLRKISVRR